MMHIEGMTVGPHSHPAFKENIEISFDGRVNLFIGPNACGKTSLLRVLACANLVDESALYPYDPVQVKLSSDWAASFENPPRNSSLADFVGDIIRGDHRQIGNSPEWLWAIPCIFIPSTRIALPNELDCEDPVLPPNNEIDADTSINRKGSAHIFDGRLVENIYRTLHYNLKGKNDQAFNTLMQAARIAHSCSSRISSEVLIGRGHNHVSHIAHTLHSQEDYYDPLAVEPYVHPGMGALTKQGQGNRPVEQYVGDLSSGTQGALLWVLDIGLRMMHHYQDLHSDWEYAFQNYGKRWYERPAILLIDEIENHLHPTWQRRVIPALLEHFPGLQIFATTHSPFVVAGLKAGQVHLLSRDADGVVRASTNTEDVVGWTADEILRTMMGVDDPTDDETARNAAELRRLRDEGPRDTEDAEAARQGRMQELRRLVDRDLLAGGPAAAQRELFEQQFAEALEKYQRSRDLGQDSG